MESPPELHLDSNAAEEMAANAVLKYLHECGAKDKEAWIARVFAKVKAKLTH